MKCKDKRKALLYATMELVNNHGFHDAPMAKIAKMAGVAPGTIYLYFENKDDLIHKLYLEVKHVFGQQAFSGYSGDMPVKKGFQLIWKNIAGCTRKEIDFLKFIAQCENSPMISDKARSIAMKEFQPLLDLWKRGQDEGIIKPIPDFLLFAFTICPLYFMHSVSKGNVSSFSEQNWDEAFQAAWDSIKI